MSGGNGMDSIPEYMLSGARGILLAPAATSRGPGTSNAYPLLEASGHD
jgi:hypothetical protein